MLFVRIIGTRPFHWLVFNLGELRKKSYRRAAEGSVFWPGCSLIVACSMLLHLLTMLGPCVGQRDVCRGSADLQLVTDK